LLLGFQLAEPIVQLLQGAQDLFVRDAARDRRLLLLGHAKLLADRTLLGRIGHCRERG
jgi:hypothetical protein